MNEESWMHITCLVGITANWAYALGTPLSIILDSLTPRGRYRNEIQLVYQECRRIHLQITGGLAIKATKAQIHVYKR